MVKKLHKHLKIPVCCKIRILPNEKDTLDLCKKIEEAGCSILTVHGRTKEQNKHKVAECDWDIIKKIKMNANIPIFANGGIYRFQDVKKCLEKTGVDGVMSAEALLENPALFSGEKLIDLDALAKEYIEFWQKYDGKNLRYLKPHLFKILHQGLKEHSDLRTRLGEAKTFEEHSLVMEELAERRKDIQIEDKFGWYHRYNTYKKPNTNTKIKKDKKIDISEGIISECEEEKQIPIVDSELVLGKRPSSEKE